MLMISAKFCSHFYVIRINLIKYYIFVSITESCLNMNILRQPNGETKWRLPAGTKKFSLNLVLPRGLTCSQCVMQWKWNTGNIQKSLILILKQ